MLLERIYDEDLAQASYFIGCQRTGDAIVVDPRRDIAVYERLAQKLGMKIVAVTETHIHADYLSGTRELAAATGATMYVSGEGGADWQYGFDAVRLYDGGELRVGNIVFRALHTPGHTPEHLAFLVTDTAFASGPGYLLSGDFVFVGDLGRPDLLDEAAGGTDTRFAGARQMFVSLREKFLTLPDHIQVYPGHGAGSACGKALGALPATTVGYERLYAWWAPYVEAGDEDGFVAELLDSQPDAPFYFGRMKRLNREGPHVLGRQHPLEEFDRADVSEQLGRKEVVFIDTRAQDLVHKSAIVGALNVPTGNGFAGYAAWLMDPENQSLPVVLLASGQQQAQELGDAMLRVGIDTVSGYVTSTDGFPSFKPAQVSPDELDRLETALVLDVRTASEHELGHVPGSVQLHGGRVMWQLDNLPATGTIVTYCQSGVRSSVVASGLRSQGRDVVELAGSYVAWQLSRTS